MAKRRRKFIEFLNSAEVLKTVHATLAVFWVIMVPVALLTGLKNSVPFLVGISIYALIIGHWDGWQSTRVEVAQEEAITGDQP